MIDHRAERRFPTYRVLWPDHFGLARGAYLPASRADDGVTSFSVAAFLQGYDQRIYEVEAGVNTAGLPDLEASFDLADARPGWEPDTGTVLADLSFEGEPFEASPRQVLRRAIDAWDDRGYRPKVGIELEAYLMQPDDEHGWAPVEARSAYLYGTGSMLGDDGLIAEIMAKAERCRIPIESVNAELGAPQFEFALACQDALTAVDSAFLLKELAREAADARGRKLTFMGKPIVGAAPSGLHINFSLSDEDGQNALADEQSHDGLSTLARHAIAGLLEHHEALGLLAAPTVNAYKRLVPGEMVGQWANWGYDNRYVAVRVPPQRGDRTRIEHRLADGAANPYLMAAGVLQAALLGVDDYLFPEDEEAGGGREPMATRRSPATLGDAVLALRADETFVDALGPEAVENLCDHKALEWQFFCDSEPHWRDKLDLVSPWELETYLPVH